MPITENQVQLTRDPLFMDQIIINPPGWLLRSGMTVFTFVIFACLILSWIIKYPDKVTAPLILTSENPPISVVSKVAAQIDTILVKDEKVVTQGDLLLIMRSTADWQAIKELSEWLTQLSSLKYSTDFIDIGYSQNWEIGELQNSYSGLVQKITEFQYFLAQNLTKEKVEAIQSEIIQIDELNQSLANQERIYDNELQLVEKDYERTLLLNQTKSASDKELETAISQLLEKKRVREGLRSGIIQNKIRQKQLQTQELELLENEQKDFNIRLIAIKKDIAKLQEEIQSWSEKYVIQAPITGMLSFSEGLTIKKYYNNAQLLGSILPQDSKGRIICRAYLSPFGVGKVEVENRAFISLEAYPDKEFGTIPAQIDRIIPLPAKSNNGETYYTMECYLPNVLLTTYGNIIPFQQQLNGTITIITKDKRLIERFFENVLSVFKTD